MHTQSFTTLGPPLLGEGGEEEEEEEEEEKKTTNLVATLFATQPVYNTARAAHALRSVQYLNQTKHLQIISMTANIMSVMM